MAKEKIICDTDVLIDYWNTKNKRHKSTLKILEEDIELDNVVLSAITRMELLMGTDNKVEEKIIQEKLKRFNLALINDEITQTALNLFDEHRLSHNLKIPDCFIAATCLVTKLKLFSYNIRDYQFIDKIKLYFSKP